MRFTIFFSLALAALGSYAEDVAPTTSVSSSACLTPTKRREWRDLSWRQRTGFVDAIKCLGKLPHDPKLAPTGDTPNLPPLNTSSSYYDDFVYAHMDSNIKDHFTALFLPWHRWYLHTFLEALQTKCGYKGELPYWNWSLDVKNMTSAAVFDSSPDYGLGTLGTASNNYAITDGALGDVVRAYPTPHVITRNFTHYPFRSKNFPVQFNNPDMPARDALTSKFIEGIVDGSKGNYTNFAYLLDGIRAQGPHNAAHLMMGGDLSDPLVSPNDVLFWLHHANLDRIWAKWQARRIENKDAYGGGLTQDLKNYDTYPVGAPPTANKQVQLPTVGLTGPVKVEDVMSTQGRHLCYKYA